MQYSLNSVNRLTKSTAGILSKLSHTLTVCLLMFAVLALGTFGCSHHDRSHSGYNSFNHGKAAGFYITPGSAVMLPGMSLQIYAYASYKDGYKEDVSEKTEWTVSDTELASVEDGLVSALAPGTVTVKAEFEEFSETAEIQITSAAAEGYVVVSSSGIVDGELSVIDGVNEELHVYANLDDGTTVEITDSVIWESSDPDVAYMSDEGILCTQAPGQAVITGRTADGELVAQFTVEVAEAELVSVTLSRTELTVPAGYSDSVTARASFDNGETRCIDGEASWSSSDDSVASVAVEKESGGSFVKIKGLKEGNAVITASFNGKSAECQVEVTAAKLITLFFDQGREIEIASGLTAEATVTGGFSDGTSRDVTSDVKASSGDENTVAVASGKKLTLSALNPGTAKVAAEKDGLTAELNVTVTDAVVTSLSIAGDDTVAAGRSIALTVTAALSDGTAGVEITPDSWTSDDTSTAMVTDGVVWGLKAGKVTVTAKAGEVSAEKEITVSDAVVTSLFIEGKDTVIAGRTIDLTAVAAFSDGTAQEGVTPDSWTSSDPETASVVGGTVQGIKAGTVTVTATMGDAQATKEITVSAAVLTSLTIQGVDNVIAGESISLKALGDFSDGTSGEDVTSEVLWTSGDTGTALVTDGLVRGLKTGKVTVTAKQGEVSAEKEITVKDAVVTSLFIEGKDTVIAGRSIDLTAVAAFSDGTAGVTVTPDSWTSSVPETASVAGGTVQGLEAGTVVITAKCGSVEATKEITVSAAVLTVLTIEGSGTVNADESISLKALGDFSDGTTGEDVSSDVMWTSSDTGTALVTNGLVRTLKSGTVTVTAKLGDVSAEKEITVNEAVLAVLKVISKRTTLPIGHEAYLSLVAEYSDGSIVTDLTAEEWRSSAPEVATVDDGVVTGLAVGKATFTAVYGGLEADSKEMTVFSEVDELTIESDSTKVDLAGTMQLRLKARYINGRTSHVTDEGKWSSTDEEIATVSATGVVTGVKMGSATIKAEFEGAEATLDIEVTATEAIVERIADYVDGQWILDEENVLYKLGYYDSVTTISSMSYHLYKDGVKVTAIDIPEMEEADGRCYLIVGIGVDAFKKCSSLTSVTIPDSVTKVDENAFIECTGLTSIVIPDSVTYLGEYAFRQCTGLKTAVIGNNVPELKSNTFKDCSKLSTVTIGDNVVAFGNQVFYHCTSLTAIELPAGMNLIDTGVFWGCTNLKTVSTRSGEANTKLPDGVTFIGENAFNGCSKIQRLDIPDGAATIGSNAFKGVQHIYYNGEASGSPWGASAIN